jgi:hypothetical protein
MDEPQDQDHVGERAVEGQNPEMPDRAEEKRVDVPQNEAPVEDNPTQTDAPTQTEVTETTTVTETPVNDGGSPNQE